MKRVSAVRGPFFLIFYEYKPLHRVLNTRLLLIGWCLLRETDKMGYTLGAFEQNGVPYFRRGTRQPTPAIRFQFAFWRLHPSRTVCG